MLCLEVTRNGERLCLAGLARGGIDLSVMVSNPVFVPSTLYVGGVASEEPMFAVEWLRDELPVGELISFRLVEADSPDSPRMSTPVPDPVMESNDIRLAREECRQWTDRMQALEKRWVIPGLPRRRNSFDP